MNQSPPTAAQIFDVTVKRVPSYAHYVNDMYEHTCALEVPTPSVPAEPGYVVYDYQEDDKTVGVYTIAASQCVRPADLLTEVKHLVSQAWCKREHIAALLDAVAANEASA